MRLEPQGSDSTSPRELGFTSPAPPADADCESYAWFSDLARPEATSFPVMLDSEFKTAARLDTSWSVSLREARLLPQAPWVRTLGRLDFSITTEGWKFPAPPPELDRPPASIPTQKSRDTSAPASEAPAPPLPDSQSATQPRKAIRPQPTRDTVLVKDRLLMLLQPPLNDLFQGRQLQVPFEPFPYQLEGIAFLMPRHAALLADEMGLGKTAQSILAMRLLYHQGIIWKALLIAPKPLIHNWSRELKLWAPDLPFEIFPNDPDARRTTWFTSNCPLKLINYESLTRDAEWIHDPQIHFDLVLLDEAQRIKNRGSKTAEVVASLKRDRSWALTGTPVENRPDDLINIFHFVEPGRVPADTPLKQLAQLTSGSILRRTKDIVQSDMPPKLVGDVDVELTPAQRRAYDRAENDGVVHLNELGSEVTVQHVFQLVMRLKQICNFDPLTGDSAKLEHLLADMEEVADSGRKALIFSQWVEPLEVIAAALEPYGPLLYHGRIPQKERTPILDRFREDESRHVLLMTYGTGSVGLNLQFTNYVFLFDRWWNPAIEDQAINRAHRIGQKYPVTVKRFICEETIEQKIAVILDAKRQVFQELIAQANKPVNLGLTEDEIFGLFDIQHRPHRR